MADTEKFVMRCPFRIGEDGEYKECYLNSCMSYYELPCLGCVTDDTAPKGTPMCRMFGMNRSNVVTQPNQYPYQLLNYGPYTAHIQ